MKLLIDMRERPETTKAQFVGVWTTSNKRIRAPCLQGYLSFVWRVQWTAKTIKQLVFRKA